MRIEKDLLASLLLLITEKRSFKAWRDASKSFKHKDLKTLGIFKKVSNLPIFFFRASKEKKRKKRSKIKKFV